MRKFIVMTVASMLTGCGTINGVDTSQVDNNKQLIKAVGTIAVVALVAGAVGSSQHKSKCENNRAGFYQDHSTGKIYTC